MADMAKRNADSIFYELTRSVCPWCLAPVDAQVLICDAASSCASAAPATAGPRRSLPSGRR